jgi:hypothetical protein
MPNKKSMLEREQYVAGGLGKFIPKNLGEKISEGIDYLKKHYDDVTTEPTPGQLKIQKATNAQREARAGVRNQEQSMVLALELLE